jgi:hypothetical protein
LKKLKLREGRETVEGRQEGRVICMMTDRKGNEK